MTDDRNVIRDQRLPCTLTVRVSLSGTLAYTVS